MAFSPFSVIYSELSAHLNDLEPFLGTKPFRSGMGVIDKMKVVLKQAGELLASELVAKTLTEVNRKIASSLQNFVVRSCCLFDVRRPHSMKWCRSTVTYGLRRLSTKSGKIK
jgi:hypothetical protein